MLHFFRFIVLGFFALGAGLKLNAQCNLLNATGCQCADASQVACDLLPDITSSWYGLQFHSTSFGVGPREYSQSGNGAQDGRLRISLSTPNIGAGPLTVRGVDANGFRWFLCGTDTFSVYDPNSSQSFYCPSGAMARQLILQRIYRKNSDGSMGYTDRLSGTMTYHPTHGHNHVDDWGVYTLRLENPNDPNPLNWPIIGDGAKMGFCLMDYGSCSFYMHHCKDTNMFVNQGTTLTNSMFPNYGLGGVGMNSAYNCSPIEQGISSGWTDIYGSHLDGMWINIPPGVCNGQYWIVVDTDPNDHFLESDETNNWAAIPVTLSLQSPPGTYSGLKVLPSAPPKICLGSSIQLTATPGFHYVWNTGDTIQTITVTQPGNYWCTVTNHCGTGNTDTLTVSVIPAPAAPSVPLVSPICSGDSVLLHTSDGSSVQWNDAIGNVLGLGDTLAVGGIMQSTYFTYTGTIALNDTLMVGLSQNVGGGYILTEQGMFFDVMSPLRIRSVKVFANSNGIRQIRVENNMGGIVYDTLVMMFTGVNSVNLNFALSPSTDYLIKMVGVNANCYRTNSGVQYPYSIPGVIRIKNSTTGSGQYYWFYDWEIIGNEQLCTSDADTAWVSVWPSTLLQLNVPDSIDVSQGSLVLNAQPTGGQWSGNGVNNGVFDPMLSGTGGPFTLVYQYSDTHGCVSSDSTQIWVISTAGNFTQNDLSIWMQLTPNPGPGKFKFSLEALPGSGLLELSLFDLAGKHLWDGLYEVFPGNSSIDLDLRALPQGVYILRSELGTLSHSERLVIRYE